MVVGFELEGQCFTAINDGPAYKLDEAFSLLVGCTEQADIDRLWTALGDRRSQQGRTGDGRDNDDEEDRCAGAERCRGGLTKQRLILMIHDADERLYWKGGQRYRIHFHQF
jgi:hypothetical protein